MTSSVVRALAVAIVGAVAAASPVPALAQDVGPALNPSLMVGWSGGNAVHSANKRSAPVAPIGSAFRAAPGPRGATARLTYAVTPALKRQVLSEFLARVERHEPSHAAAARAQFARNDYGRVYQGLVTPFGLGGNDAADSLSAYVVLGYLIVNGAGDPSPASVRGVRAQVADLMAREPRFADPVTRAKLGEEFKILFVTLHSGWQSARREGNAGRYAEGVGAMMRQQAGLDLRAMTLGNGLRPRG